ncbi:MAG: thioredoxin-dependent thiol peroxidase [Nakamurella sp.]
MTTTLPATGDTAPGFTLTDADANPVSLSDFSGKKVILYFYPAAMTPGCTTEACEFTAARQTLDTGGYVVLGVSPDAPDKLVQFRTQENLDITLLSDPDHSVHEQYGAWGEKSLYGKKMMGVIRSTFVIDENGTLTQVWRNVKATGHVDRVLEKLGLSS